MRSGLHQDNHQSKQQTDLPRWLTVDQIRRLQRMRREEVLRAMDSGELRFEQRGRIRYSLFSDVLSWEQSRLSTKREECGGFVHPDLANWM